MNAVELEQTLARAGIHARVESRGKLALIAIRDATALRDPNVRNEAIGLATSLGFIQVALEIHAPATDRASVPRP